MNTFEPGKTYRTRDGREARVYAVDGGGSYPVHGAIKNLGGSWVAETWTAGGRRGLETEESRADLLPPTPIDEASWRAGAEAMREAIIRRLNRPDAPFYSAGHLARHTEIPSLPAPPAAPAPEPERLSGECWVNVYEGGAVECYRQRSYADNFQSSCGNPRIACIRIDLSQHRKGEGL